MRTVVLLAWLCGACGRLGFDENAGDAGGDTPQPGTVFAIAAHVSTTCAIVEGALWCWGQNMHGQLATGDVADRFMPVQIGGDSDWIAVAVGQDHICGIRFGGALYCWGGNGRGQLGIGDMLDRPAPMLVPLAGPAVEIDAYFHTCAVLQGGALYCWGRNDEGQLAQDDSTGAPDHPSPVPVGSGTVWTHVTVGQGTTHAIAGGVLYGTGRNSTSEVGLGGGPAQVRVMTIVDTGPWALVVGGQSSSCGQRQDGSLACWGSNVGGQLGTGDMMMRDVPTTIAGQVSRTIDTDTFHSCSLGTANALWCWGRDVEGQLGTGDAMDRTTPTLSAMFDDWLFVSVGRFHTCGMRVDHSIWCVGQNSSGQVGDTNVANHHMWTRAL